jgi:uncharacterized membrane protein (DUF373 family)
MFGNEENLNHSRPDRNQSEHDTRDSKHWGSEYVPSWYLKGVKGVLIALLVIQLSVMIWATLETAISSLKEIPNGLLSVLKTLLVDSLLILALLEVSRTVVAYFTLGRVKITFIVDTVLAVFLSEALVIWFSGESVVRAIELVILLLVLTVMRFVAVRYHPTGQGEDGEPPYISSSLGKLWGSIVKKAKQEEASPKTGA